AGRSSGPATPSAACPPSVPSHRAMWSRQSSTAWGSTSSSTCPARTAARSRWSISGIVRFTNCSEGTVPEGRNPTMVTLAAEHVRGQANKLLPRNNVIRLHGLNWSEYLNLREDSANDHLRMHYSNEEL